MGMEGVHCVEVTLRQEHEIDPSLERSVLGGSTGRRGLRGRPQPLGGCQMQGQHVQEESAFPGARDSLIPRVQT